MRPTAMSAVLHHTSALRVLPASPIVRRSDAIWHARGLIRAARGLRHRPMEHALALRTAAVARRIAQRALSSTTGSNAP